MIRAILALLAPALAAGAALAASPAAESWASVPRKILAIYSEADLPKGAADLSFHPIHLRAEMPLNHLGMEVVYWNASGPLPDPERLDDYRGVLTWFATPPGPPEPARLCSWLRRASRRGLRWVAVGEPWLSAPGPPGRPRQAKECAALWREAGAELTAVKSVDALSARVEHADRAIVGFEREFDPSERGSLPVVRLRPGATAYLRVAFTDGPPHATEPVALTRRGAFALQPAFLYENRELDPPQARWVVDPFLFFERGFALEGLPRPDPTTLHGRRVALHRVDGDGFFNRSELDPRKTSGEVFLREVLEARPDTPFTVSLIAGYYDLAGFSDEESVALSRRVLSRGHVEPASHGYAHPTVWATREPALRIPRYRVTAEGEVLASTRLIAERLLGRGPPPGVFFWTGDCLPTPEDLAAARAGGLLAMNGGGGRFDSRYPSYAFLFPLSRSTGALRQYYAPSYNENDYTGLWKGPFYGYREVAQTFERTGSPRRVKPVDVYVHFYSAEKFAALRALQGVLDGVRAAPLVPVWASRYLKSVEDFFAMRIRRSSEGAFRLEGGAYARTLRFDGKAPAPDVAASRGVIGYRRELGSLFVFLDESAERELRFSASPPRVPRLEEAGFEVFRWRRLPGGVRFDRQGWWGAEFALAGLDPGGRYRVRSAGYDAQLVADPDGSLRVRLPDAERGGPPREVLVERAG